MRLTANGGEGDPSPLKNPPFYKVLGGVRGLEKGATHLGKQWRGEQMGRAEEGGGGSSPPPAYPLLCRLREGGDKYPRCCVEWGDGQACRVRNNELKESFSE